MKDATYVVLTHMYIKFLTNSQNTCFDTQQTSLSVLGVKIGAHLTLPGLGAAVRVAAVAHFPLENLPVILNNAQTVKDQFSVNLPRQQ